MKHVLHIYGASGSGTSTLGRQIAEQLGWLWMDTDEYYWVMTEPKYQIKRTPKERLEMMIKDIREAENVVISGALTGWGDALIPFFTMTVRLVTDTEIRIERLKKREKEKFGDRILVGGDMYQHHQDFLAWAEKYDTAGTDMRSKAKHDEWQKTLPCRQLILNGADNLDENFLRVKRVIEQQEFIHSLPRNIQRQVENSEYNVDNIGLSASSTILFGDKVLKIQDINEETENEHAMMVWLDGKLPVPKVLEFEHQDDKNYLLMSRVSGKMACADEYMRQPKVLTKLLAESLKMLWRVDISDCPFQANLDKKLEMAEYFVKNNEVDLDNVEPETFGENGFKEPVELLEWLKTHRPAEEIVLTHGDFCLPNVFFNGENVAGFIDIGKCGTGDKWMDIALCYRSLKHNFDGVYNGIKYEGFEPEMLFKELGIEPDWEKIRYYILLDELF